MVFNRRFSRKKNRGVSEVIGTVIVGASLLIVALVTVSWSSSYLDLRNLDEEFSQAIEVTKSLDDLIRGLALQPDASGYITYQFKTVAPNVVQTGENLTLIIRNETIGQWNTTKDINIIKFTSNAASYNQVISGENSPLVVGQFKKMGLITMNRTSVSSINLDYARIKVSNSGVQKFYNSVTQTYDDWNVLEIMFIGLKDGIRTNPSVIQVKNSGFSVEQILMVGNGSIQVISDYPANGITSQIRLQSDLSLNTNLPTLVNLIGIELTIS